MSITVTLSLTGEQHGQLKHMLFPGDRKEAVAVALCGQRKGDRRHRLLVRELYEIQAKSRTCDKVEWEPDLLVPILERAESMGWAVVKFHSHPEGQAFFSAIDLRSDETLLPMLRGWLESTAPIGSVVMLPDGQLFGRALADENMIVPISVISVVDDDLHFWYSDSDKNRPNDFCASHAQLFGQGTMERLQRLSVAVVGCSGTGSPVIEQLARLGVGELVLVDDDCMEKRNLNRVYNSTMDDALRGRFKVDVLAEAIKRAGLQTSVLPIRRNLWSIEAVHAVAQCDVVIGCMDSVDGRYLLNSLATFYTIPYFDVGVRLVATRAGECTGEIREVCGSVHYLLPGKSSMLSRDVFTMEDVRNAGLLRNDPEAHKIQRKDGYILGVEEHNPAVISVNSFGASLIVNELLARVHPYREEVNCNYAWVNFSLSSMEFIMEAEWQQKDCDILRSKVGLGDMVPPLDMPELS